MRTPQLPQPICHEVAPVVIETETIDDRAALGHAKDPWLGISRLRSRGDRPDFREAEAERFPGRKRHRILVEAGRETHRIWKGDAEDGPCEPRIGGGLERP